MGQQIHEQPVEVYDYYCKQSPDYLEVPFKLYGDDIIGQSSKKVKFFKVIFLGNSKFSENFLKILKIFSKNYVHLKTN